MPVANLIRTTHTTKTCTHVRKEGAFFIGSDEKLPILQLKNTPKVHLSFLPFSSNNLSLHEPLIALYPQSGKAPVALAAAESLPAFRPLKLQLIHVSLSLRPLGYHICKHFFFNVETFAACGARCYLTSARFGCSRRSPAHARSQHKPCFVPRRLHQKPSTTPKRC